MNAIMMRAALLCSVLGLCAGCGDDGASASAARPPTVGLPVVECGAYSGEGNLGEYTGDVLLGLTVQVTDPNGDLSYVDATVDGAPFRLAASESGTEFSYSQDASSNQIARCSQGTFIVVRAVDLGGLVTTVEVTVE